MPATLRDLIDETLAQLHSWTGEQEQYATLTAGIDTDDLVMQVDDVSYLSRGLIEIDSELIAVASVSQTSNLLTAPAWGRAQQASVAAAHVAGSKVTLNPRHPRARVMTVINEVLASLYPDLYAVKTDLSQKAISTRLTYQLPTDCVQVLGVHWETTGPTQMWAPIRRWEIDRKAATSDFPTGVSINLLDSMTPGRTIKFTYRAEPAQFAAEADVLTTKTGLPESCRDLLVWGAAGRLLMALEPMRLQQDAVEESNRSNLVPPGSASAAGRAALQMFQLRLEQERSKLAHLYPPVAHLTR